LLHIIKLILKIRILKILNDNNILPFSICNFDETSLLIKNHKKRKVYSLKNLRPTSLVIEELMTSITLFLCVFVDGFVAPNFIILPRHWIITEKVKSMFNRNFKIKFFVFYFLLYTYYINIL
jgi:hypothetical protein